MDAQRCNFGAGWQSSEAFGDVSVASSIVPVSSTAAANKEICFLKNEIEQLSMKTEALRRNKNEQFAELYRSLALRQI